MIDPNDTAVAITIGNGNEFALTQDNRLVVRSRNGTQEIYLGQFTKARSKELREYLERLEIFIP